MSKFFLAAIAAVMTCVSLLAQAPGTGAYPFASFDNRGFDSVNLGNNNIRFTIPIMNKAGRGLGFNYAIQYEGLIWNPVSNGSTTVWTPAPNWGFTGQLNGTAFSGYLTYLTTQSKCLGSRGTGGGTPNIEQSNFVYHDPFGAAHNFQYSTTQGCPDGPGPTTVGNGSSNDGSGYTLVNGYEVMTRNGSIITPGSSATGQNSSSITDSNGNEINFNGTGSFTDTTGSTALTIAGSSPVSFTYPVVKQSNGATTASATLSYRSYTVRTNFQVSGVVEYGSNTVNLVDHITLADGSTYSFTYEGTPGASDGAVTARIASVTLPTGGTISYAYRYGWPGSINTDGTPAGLTRTTSDGSKQYNRSYSQYPVTTEYLLDEKGNETDFNFIAGTNGNTYETSRSVYQGANSSGSVPLETRTTVYNGQSASTELTSQPVEVDVTTSSNGGSQTLAKNAFDTSGDLLSTAVYSGSNLQEQTVNSYSSPGNLIELNSSTTTDPSGNLVAQTTYGYDETSPTATSGLPQHTGASGTRGNQTSIHVTYSGSSTLTTTTAYYDTGTPVSTTAPDGGVTQYSYDSTGTFATQTTLPTTANGTALVTSASYDTSSGASLSVSGPNSGQTTTTNSYDPLLRPTQITQPTGGQTNISYVSSGHWTASKALGTGPTAQLDSLLDAYGRASRSSVYNGSSNASQDWYQVDTCYDATGLVNFVSTRYQGSGNSAAKRCSGSGTAYTYDALGRVTSVQTSDGTATAQYQNRAVLTKDVNGVQRITQYDLLGRLSGICEISSNTLNSVSPASCGMDIGGTGFVTSYTYNLASHLTTIMQGTQTRTFQTDAAGRPVITYEPERSTTTYGYSYNGKGLQVKRMRPKANQTGSATTSTTIQYDTLGRILSVSYDDGLTPTKNYWYDVPGQLGWSATPNNPKGNLVSAATTTSSGAVSTSLQFSYDQMGQLVTVWQCAPSICGTSNQQSRGTEGSSYDYLGNVTGTSDGASGSISYSRSAAGELASMTQNSYTDSYNPPNLVTNVVNGPFGPTSWSLSNGLATTQTFDSLGRKSGVYLCPGSSNGVNCSGELYGNSTSWSGLRATESCDTVINQCQGQGYDEFNRLTTVSGGNSSYTYTYDQYGNRLTQTSSPSGPVFSHNFNSNQIVGIAYDAAGNMMGDGISHTFTYDAEGNVLTVDNGSTATYVYDALNRRVSAQTSAGTSEYVYNAQGQRTSSWLLNGSAGGAGNEGRIYWDGQQFGYRAWDGQTFFQHKSPLGTDRVRTNYQGQVATTETSLAFGDGFSSSNTNMYGSGQDNDQYAGLEHDQESFSEHATFRQYSSTQGRWMSPDPYDGSYDSTNPQSLNRYSYVLNNPFSYTDPSGQISQNPSYDPTYWAPSPGPPQLPWYITEYGSVPCLNMNGGGNICPSLLSTSQTSKPAPSKVGCGTVLPNGQTVGSVVRQQRANLQNAFNASASQAQTGTPYNPLGYQLGAFTAIVGPNGPIDFKKGQTGQTFVQMGLAGNFAYYAIGAGFFSPTTLDLGAGAYALTAAAFFPHSTVHFSDLTGNFFSDSAAAQMRGPGLAAGGCSVP